MVLIGQPDSHRLKLDNPIFLPQVLGMLTYHRWNAEVKGLDEFPRDQWPDQQELLYYGFHIMVGLGTVFIGLMILAALWLWRGKLFEARWLLWTLMLAAPFPYIANTRGWMTAELGRQPWLIYGLLRTAEGASTKVNAGNTLFTLIGFMGIYELLSILFVVLMQREIEHGPSASDPRPLTSDPRSSSSDPRPSSSDARPSSSNPSPSSLEPRPSGSGLPPSEPRPSGSGH